MAIPGLFRPLVFPDKVLIDGGRQILEYDLLFGLSDIIVAVDMARSPLGKSGYGRTARREGRSWSEGRPTHQFAATHYGLT